MKGREGEGRYVHYEFFVVVSATQLRGRRFYILFIEIVRSIAIVYHTEIRLECLNNIEL